MDQVVEEQVSDERPPVVPPVVMTLSAPEPDETAQYDAAAERAFNDQAPEEQPLDTLSTELLREFAEAEQLRLETEQRWLRDLRQFRGIYETDVMDTLVNRSQAFVRRTRVKVVTTDSRMMDYLFPAGQEKNWTCESTPKPSVSEETKAMVREQLAQKNGGQPPSDKDIDEAVIAMAKVSAKAMSTVIEDQLVETRYKQITRKALHSGNLYGTGIVKGPLVERKVRQRFQQEKNDQGEQTWTPKSEEYIVPFVEHVPLWRFYPDMAGAVDLEEARFAYELHRMTRQKFASLISRKTFKGETIKKYLEANPRGASRPRSFELELHSLGEREGVNVRENGMYDVLERWGWLTGEQLTAAGVKIPEERMYESFFSNVWLLPTGEVIKAVLQPINGVTWPYHLYYFDKDETSIFGEGLASIMRDDQDMLNAAVRMMLDNGALTSGPMLEIAIDELSTTDKADEIFPWKIWYRKKAGDLSRPAIRQIQLENNIEWLSKMAAMFEQNTDEVTAIPRYMTGENATTGAAGTASGMSMLMGAANIVIKELLNSWDEGVTRTFIQSLYRWNMQFSSDNAIKGDFDVKARGTASLIAKEVKAQQLNNFASTTAKDPAFAPFIKGQKLLQQIAEAAEMTEVVKTDDEIREEQESEEGKRMADMQRQLQEAQLGQEIAKAQKLAAEAQVAKTKVDEMLKNIELTVATIVEKRVETIFAALQAGGVATRDPVTAPAGDEILRSAGYTDLTPSPSIAQLDGPPVQQQQSSQRIMSRGETFTQDPRVAQAQVAQAQALGSTTDAVPQDPTTVDPRTTPPGPASDPEAHALPDANTGQRQGIETTRIEA